MLGGWQPMWQIFLTSWVNGIRLSNRREGIGANMTQKKSPGEAATSAGGKPEQKKTHSKSLPNGEQEFEGRPSDLSEGHWHMLTVESGLSSEVIVARHYQTVTTKADLKSRGFSDSQLRVPTLLIPIYDVHGELALYQARPDEPRIKNGRPIKYETLSGGRMVLDCHPSIRHQLANPTVPLWITEGIKKGDSLVSHGCLLGVWNWRGTNEYGGKTALPDWEHIALNGRLVHLAFDSDVMVKPNVSQALVRLSALLTQRGAQVRYIYLPGGESGAKIGVDDYLVEGHTVKDLLTLATDQLREPPTTEVPAKQSRPIIQVNNRFLRETVDDALDALQKTNDPPVIFRRGSVLVPSRECWTVWPTAWC